MYQTIYYKKIEYAYILFVNMSESIVNNIYATSQSNFVAICDEDVHQTLAKVLNNCVELSNDVQIFVNTIRTSEQSYSAENTDLVSQFGPISVGLLKMFIDVQPVVDQIMFNRSEIPGILNNTLGGFVILFNIIENHFNNMVSKENQAHRELAKLTEELRSLSSSVINRVLYNKYRAYISLAVVELNNLGIVDMPQNLLQFIYHNDLEFCYYDTSVVALIEFYWVNRVFKIFTNFVYESRDDFYIDQYDCSDVITAIEEIHVWLYREIHTGSVDEC